MHFFVSLLKFLRYKLLQKETIPGISRLSTALYFFVFFRSMSTRWEQQERLWTVYGISKWGWGSLAKKPSILPCRVLLIPGMGNRERESGNECTAVIRIRIQNGGRQHGKGSGNKAVEDCSNTIVGATTCFPSDFSVVLDGWINLRRETRRRRRIGTGHVTPIMQRSALTLLAPNHRLRAGRRGKWLCKKNISSSFWFCLVSIVITCDSVKLMAFVYGSPAPLRDVKLVQFGVLSPDEIVSIL